MHRKDHTSANKEDPILDALEAYTGFEWRHRGTAYECRVNRTHATNIVVELGDIHVEATAEVSEARSGRYIVTVPVTEGPKILNGAALKSVE